MLGKSAMEIFVRLFLWMLRYTYGRRGGGTLYGPSAMDEVLLNEHDKEREEKRKDHVVEEFKSDAAPVQGAVDYADMKWDSFTRVVETPEQFEFYSGPTVQKRIAKSEFSSPQELATLRRVIRRYAQGCELRED